MFNEVLYFFHILFLLTATFSAFIIDRALLRALVCVEIVLANLFVVNRMVLCGLAACGGGMYVVGSMCGLLLLQAYQGQQYARRTFYIGFVFAIVFFVLTRFQVWYAPHFLDRFHPLFVTLLARVPHVTVASLVAHFVGQFSTLQLQLILLRLTQGRWISLVSVFSITIGQVLDSVIFFIGAFIGSIPFSAIVDMIIVGVGLKTVMAIASGGLVALAQRLRPRRDYV